MKRAIFVNRFYWPETPATGQLLTDLASELVERGWQVLVITSAVRASGVPREESHRGVAILRVSVPRSTGTGVGGKLIAFVGFALAALLQLLRRARRGDIVVTLTDPPLLGIPAGIAARMKGCRVVHWVQDIYPEIAVAVSGHAWLRTLIPFRDAAWRQADQCVTLGHEMAGVLANAGVPSGKIAIIPNWPPIELRPRALDDEVRRRRQQVGVDRDFVVGYSGNLGRVHDLSSVVAAAELLRERPGIRFVFTGSGAQQAALQQQAANANLKNITFLPPQPRTDLELGLALANIHLVTLRSGCEAYVFPSKFYGIVAVGRPVLFVGPQRCEIARLIEAAGIGTVVEAGNPRALAAVVTALATDPARVAGYANAALRFAKEVRFASAADHWEKVLALAHAS